MTKTTGAICVAVSILKGSHDFFTYSKNLKLLFILGLSCIIENMHCHCYKTKKEKHSKENPDISVLTSMKLSPQQNHGMQFESVCQP